MSDTMSLFDPRQRRLRRDRAASAFAGADFLKRIMVDDLVDRLATVQRRFARALDVGCHNGLLAARLGVDFPVCCDLSPAMLALAPAGLPRVACLEDTLPFAPASFDLVASAGSLHAVNDLPGALAQIARLLQPDGLFIAAFVGGETLRELRECLLAAESERSAGAGLRVAPMVEVRQAGALLQRAGFAMPVADVDRLTLRYPHPLGLLKELAAMGETNMLTDRSRKPLARGIFGRALDFYVERYADPDGQVRATIDIVHVMGWAPAPGQPRPKAPGSATVSLAQALRRAPSA